MAINSLNGTQYDSIVRQYQSASTKLDREVQRALRQSSASTVSYFPIQEENPFEDIVKGYNRATGLAEDGINDGKISTGSKVKNFFKGVWNGVKGMVKGAIQHPIKTALMIGACCIPGVGPFIAGGLAAYGIAKGAVGIAKSAKAAKNATTDAEAEAAWQGIGTGSFQVGISAIAMKGAVKTIRANNAALGANSAIAKDAGIIGKATGSVKNGVTTLKNSISKIDVKAAAGNTAKSAKQILENARKSGRSKIDALKDLAEARRQASKIDQNGALTQSEMQILKNLELQEAFFKDSITNGFKTGWNTLKTKAATGAKNGFNTIKHANYRALKTPAYATFGVTEEDPQYLYQQQYLYQ